MATYDPIAAVELENDVSVRPPHDFRKQPLAPARDPCGPSLTYLNFSGRLHTFIRGAASVMPRTRRSSCAADFALGRFDGILALDPLVRHVAKVGFTQIGHHDAVGAVVANIAGIDPDDLVAIQLDQKGGNIAVGTMGRIDHGANAAAGDQLNALADQLRITVHDHPFYIAVRPNAATIGGPFGSIADPHGVIGRGAVLILSLLRLVLLQLILILPLLSLILGIVGGGLRIHRGILGP